MCGSNTFILHDFAAYFYSSQHRENQLHCTQWYSHPNISPPFSIHKPEQTISTRLRISAFASVFSLYYEGPFSGPVQTLPFPPSFRPLPSSTSTLYRPVGAGSGGRTRGGIRGEVEGENGLPFNLFVTMRPNWNFLLSGQQVPWFADQVSTTGHSHFPLSSEQVVEKYRFLFLIFKVLCQIGSVFRVQRESILYTLLYSTVVVFFWGGGRGWHFSLKICNCLWFLWYFRVELYIYMFYTHKSRMSPNKFQFLSIYPL